MDRDIKIPVYLWFKCVMFVLSGAKNIMGHLSGFFAGPRNGPLCVLPGGEKITYHTLRISDTVIVIRTKIVLRNIICQTVHRAQPRLGIQALVQFVQPRCPNIIYVALPRTWILVEQLTGLYAGRCRRSYLAHRLKYYFSCQKPKINI